MLTTSNQSNLIDRLFKAGAHFGFKKSRRHPSAKPYLFGIKHGNDIFDLERTATLLEEAKEVIKRFGSEGKTVLFVGTKEEASHLVKDRVEKIEVPYVVNRWVGGMLTNWTEIRKRVARLFELIEMGESGELERKYTKKERVVMNRELEKLTYNFGGIRNLEKHPDLMVIVDPRYDKLALSEAMEKNIPVIGIMSSDNDISKITYPVVLNDTLTASITLALDELIEAYNEGKKSFAPASSEVTRRRNAIKQN